MTTSNIQEAQAAVRETGEATVSDAIFTEMLAWLDGAEFDVEQVYGTRSTEDAWHFTVQS